jgi:hypothetical protein
MIGRLSAETAEIVAVARYHNPPLGQSTGQDIVVGRALQPDFIYMDSIIAVSQTQMPCELRGQVLVDQEARRHSRPAGRPRGGLALA